MNSFCPSKDGKEEENFNVSVNTKEWPDKLPSKTLTKTCLNDHLYIVKER